MGEWSKGIPHGFGTYLWRTKRERYRGKIKHGLRHGRGVHQFQDGSVYDGIWEDDVIEGRGIMSFASGDTYCGDWHQVGTSTNSSVGWVWCGKTKILKQAHKHGLLFLCQFYELRHLKMHTGFVGCDYVMWFGQYTGTAVLVSLFGCTQPILVAELGVCALCV